jgi:uncharacterized membrane protein YozB (DUF420 family)
LEIADFPALNATLNAVTGVLLVIAYFLIRAGRITAHRNTMIAAFVTSTLFLASYLYYHAHAGSKAFPGTGTVRSVYLSILLTHTVLAALVPPFAIVTLWRGLKNRHPSHERLARWTLPIWLYVSVTGVVVYWMLYRVTW